MEGEYLSLDTAKKIAEQDKEIERLKEELEYTIPIVEHNKTITKHLKEIERLNNIIKEVREILNTQLAFTSSYQLNYQSAMSIIEEAKSTLRGVDKN